MIRSVRNISSALRALVLFLLLPISLSPALGTSAGGKPPALLEIGRTKQLFVDAYIIESLTDARQVMNQATKHPNNPILKQHEFSFSFSAGKHIKNENYSEYVFDLPESFPKYIASTIFTNDQYNLEISIQGHGSGKAADPCPLPKYPRRPPNWYLRSCRNGLGLHYASWPLTD